MTIKNTKTVLLHWLLLMSACWCELVDAKARSNFKSIPTTIKTTEHDTVLLPCYVDHAKEPGLSIAWYKDDVLVAANGSSTLEMTTAASTEDSIDYSYDYLEAHRIHMWPNGSLEVRALRDADTGEYECRVTRPDGGIISQLHAIEVMYPPDVVMEPPSGSHLLVRLGDEIALRCEVSGVPEPVLTWVRDGNEVQLLQPKDTLHFVASQRNLAGVYECRASNGVGEPAVARTHVAIAFPPEISSNATWVHAAPGLRAALECRVEAMPPATVIWLRDGKPVHTDSRVHSMHEQKPHAQLHTLVVRHVRAHDFGEYVCRADNELGHMETKFQLSGVPNPAVFKKTEMNMEGSKDEYTVIWEVDSYSPVFEYNLWFRPYQKYNTATTPEWTKLVIPAERSTGPLHSKYYTITGLQEKTIYESVLISRNRYGWSKPSAITIFATEGADLNSSVQHDLEARIEDNIIPEEVATIASQQTPSGSSGFIPSLMVLLISVPIHSVFF